MDRRDEVRERDIRNREGQKEETGKNIQGERESGIEIEGERERKQEGVREVGEEEL